MRTLRFQHPLRLLLLLCTCVAASVCEPTDAQTLEAIPLEFRTAEDVIPILQPLLEPGSVVTGTGDVLLIRASPASVEGIRAAVAAIDRAPRQLLITVGQSTESDASRASAHGSVAISSAESRNGTTPTTVGGVIVVDGATTRDDIRNVSSVRALEGVEAYLMLGESRPFTSVTSLPGRHGPTVARTTGYRDVSTGFYVTPRLFGDRVTLELSTQQQRARTTRGQDVIHAEHASTTVTGTLGEWIRIADAQQSAETSARGLLAWSTDASGRRYSAWLKVDAIP